MYRWITVFLFTTSATLLTSCGAQPQQSAEDAYSEFRKAIREIEAPEEKTALCEDFLTRFPESEHNGSLAGAYAALGSSGVWKTLQAISEKPDTCHLAETDEFNDRFVDALALPNLDPDEFPGAAQPPE